MQKYKQAFEDFELLTEIAYELSQQFEGVFTDDKGKRISTYILAKVVPCCFSILKLIPGSKYSNCEDEYMDFPSMSSLCRNLIESSNIHWYYSVDKISDIEKEFRFILYDYHDTFELLTIAECLQFNSEDIAYLQDQLNNHRKNLESHPFFNTLQSDLRKKIIKGKRSTTLSHYEIAKKRKIDPQIFTGIYKLLSNQIHSTPASIKQLVFTRLHDTNLDMVFTNLFLYYSSSFLADLVLNTGKIWGIEFAKENSKNIVEKYSNKLRDGT